jgi:hypothetical protein
MLAVPPAVLQVQCFTGAVCYCCYYMHGSYMVQDVTQETLHRASSHNRNGLSMGHPVLAHPCTKTCWLVSLLTSQRTMTTAFACTQAVLVRRPYAIGTCH